MSATQQFEIGFYVAGSVIAALELTGGHALRRQVRAPARALLILGVLQAFLVLLFRYGDTWLPQPPASDLGGQTFLQPMVATLSILITLVALPTVGIWATIAWIIKRKRTKGPNQASEVTARKLAEPQG